MSTLRLTLLDRETFKEVTASVSNREINLKEKAKKSDISSAWALEAQDAGVKELAFMLKALELSAVCDDYLHVEYREGANKNNRMMLSKRFIESFDDKDVESWFSGCEDQAILASICSAMGYETNAKTPIRTLRQVATRQVYEYGERIILQRLTVEQLRTVCDKLNIEGADNTTSKAVLVNAIMDNSDIEKKAAPKKRVARTKKKPIEDATTYQQLFQHYLLADLQEWAAANGLKVSGTKKVLIERILAYNGGDTENTMATATNRAPRKPAAKKAPAPTPNPPTKRVAALTSGVQSSKKIVCDVPKVTSKKPNTVAKKTTKPAAKKAAPKNAPKPAKAPKKKAEPVVEEEEEDEEMVEEEEEIVEEEAPEEEEEDVEVGEDELEEEADEEPADEEPADEEPADEEPSFDEEAEKAAIDAERELRTADDEEEEDEDEEEELLSEVSNDYPTDITNMLIAISSLDKNSKHDKKELVNIIRANGGKVAKSLTREVQVILTAKGTPAYKMGLKYKIPIFGEEYLTNFF